MCVCVELFTVCYSVFDDFFRLLHSYPLLVMEAVSLTALIRLGSSG